MPQFLYNHLHVKDKSVGTSSSCMRPDMFCCMSTCIKMHFEDIQIQTSLTSGGQKMSPPPPPASITRKIMKVCVLLVKKTEEEECLNSCQRLLQPQDEQTAAALLIAGL